MKYYIYFVLRFSFKIMYLYILDYSGDTGIYIYQIDEDEDPENYISEHTNFRLSCIEWMVSDQLNINVQCS